MTDSERDNTRKTAREPGPGVPERETARPKLGWTEISFLAEGLVFGPRALQAATNTVTERYNLGPRGAWIIQIIGDGVAYPLELASKFYVGRSLITAELARLTDAGLVDTRPGEGDRRRTALTLTPLGKQARAETVDEMKRIVRLRLASFSSDQVHLAGEVLHALSREPDAPPS